MVPRRLGAPPPHHRFLALVVALLVGCAVMAPPSLAERAAPQAGAASAAVDVTRSPSPGFESDFVSRINSLRASKGLSQLQVSGQLLGVARNWTEKMVAAGQISHNPNLGSEVSGDWTKLGENVGVGYDVDGLMQAFINSSAHYENLVDPAWNYVAVGVTIASDGRMYTTHNFMAMAGATPPPPPPASTTPTTRRPATTVTTAAPPPETTTTTAPPPPQPHPTPERVTAVLEPLRSLERA
jgi:Cysteine-rich secretory protein family